MTKLIESVLLLMVLSSCVLDEIVISMAPNNSELIFNFKYLRASKKTVSLTDVRVYEAKTKRLVWEISTFDPSIDFIFVDGTPEGRRIPKKVSGTTPEVKFVQISQLTFGAIPDGYKQYVPADNKKPVLSHNVDYILSAGGATGGRILFSIDGKCRRLSSTPFSKDHPLFKDSDNCLPP